MSPRVTTKSTIAAFAAVIALTMAACGGSTPDEAADSEWVTYAYRGIAQNGIPGAPTLWHEFALGMLDGAGEILLDDVSVVEWPDGAATELIPNGSFDDGTADHWRLLGNHQRSTVVDDNGDFVLRLVASGATEYQGNQTETTLAGNVAIVDGRRTATPSSAAARRHGTWLQLRGCVARGCLAAVLLPSTPQVCERVPG